MRAGLLVSLVLHGLVLSAVLIGFTAPDRTESPQPVSVDVLTPAEFSAVKAGKPEKEAVEAAVRDEPAPPAEQPVEITQTTAEPGLSEAESQKQAALPPPKAETSEKPEATPEEPAETRQSEETPLPPRPLRAERPRPIRSVEDKPKPRRKKRPHKDQIAELLNKSNFAAREESDFNPRRISALLNRDPTAGHRPRRLAPREPWRRPRSFEEQASGLAQDVSERDASGAPDGHDARMTANEIDAFRTQVSRCWTPPVGGLGGDAIKVKLRIVLNEDGSLGSAPEIANSFASPFFRPAADSAVRAVVQCQPYRMPHKKYAQWRDMLLTFDPSRMYGG